MLAPLDKCSFLLVTTHSLGTLGALAINQSQNKDPWHLLQPGSPQQTNQTGLHAGMHPRKQDGQQEVNEDGYQFGNLQESQSIDKLLSRIFGNSGKPRIENQVSFLIRLY